MIQDTSLYSRSLAKFSFRPTSFYISKSASSSSFILVSRYLPSFPSREIKNSSFASLFPIKCCVTSCSGPDSFSTNSERKITHSSSRIFIKGLSCSTSERLLLKHFSCFGDITKVKIIMSKSTMESLGFAYIWFEHEEAALSAVKEMDGKFVDGRFIAVMVARPEAPSKHARTTPYRF